MVKHAHRVVSCRVPTVSQYQEWPERSMRIQKRQKADNAWGDRERQMSADAWQICRHVQVMVRRPTDILLFLDQGITKGHGKIV